ncbi:MAG: hypothetical protein ABTQ27_02865 [Amaricoccus sp.]|uniref:hypothetical protein n=1 Tax=Amaricoccus sp. TaxID=1872485 RepID=UPI003314C07D
MSTAPTIDDKGAAATRPGFLLVYILVIFAAMLGASLYHLRHAGILSCPATGYDDTHYLAYCHGDAYGDYDHGAVWFGLEPGVRETAAGADVLFVGNSRLEFGFSSAAIEHWAAANDLAYYLLGFSYTENSAFLGPLLDGLKPSAEAYVINLDQFFMDKASPPGAEVMFGGGSLGRYEGKRDWQGPHRLLCGALPILCGEAVSYYRDRANGQWSHEGTWRTDKDVALLATGIDGELPVDVASLDRAREIGAAFIDKLGVPRDCVVLTYVPTRENKRATADALATSLGFELVSPRLDDLRTFDGSHLDPASAERFAAAFLEVAGPRLAACANGGA